MALALVVSAGDALAQTPNPLDMLQQLSPEQRDKVLKALGGTGDVQQPEAKPLSQPEVVTPAPVTPPPANEPSTIEARYAGRTAAPDLRQPQSMRSVEQKLKQFGYDLFAGAPTTFAPATDIPVPADYVIGPGDVIEVQLFGKDNEQYSLGVTRDGRIDFPQIGSISVAGMHFAELRVDLEKRVSEQMIGEKTSVTMGPLRSIRVFVLGDVTRPGSYTVSALTTVTNALFVSGGVQPIGSLRNVQLKRNGRVVSRLDLYDLLLRGDTTDDARLQPGDVIFVPPIGATAGVAGEVRRPAIYELRGERNVRQLIEMAGGLLPTAVPALSQLERLDTKGNHTLVDLNLEDESAAHASVADGDVLRVYPNLDRMDGIVLVAGHVKRPGGVAWHDHMRLTDLLANAEQLLPQADLDYVVVRREERPLAKVSVFSTRLSAAWSEPQSDANVLLEPRDQVLVFPLAGSLVPLREDVQATQDAKATLTSNVALAGAAKQSSLSVRQDLLRPLLDELNAQASAGQPSRVVSVTGLVRDPGDYPLESTMHVSDLIRAGGGLGQAAYTLGAEITRYGVVDDKKREISHVPVDLAAVLKGDASANVALEAFDRLTIKRLPEWSEQLTAEVKGEVRFPGVYPIKRGEKLSDLLERAGGLTDHAFAEGSIFTREELRVREQERLDQFARQLESDIATMSLEKAAADSGKDGNNAESEAVATARLLLPQLKDVHATGRLVIDLPRLLERGKDSDYNVVLKGGDTLIIPATTQEVTVIGEVQYPTSHMIEKGLDADDYVGRSGGLTYRADNSRAYVVRANGEVESARSGWWIFRHASEVKPGDTIVVPIDVERMRPLTFWTSVSQIVYQLAVTVAVLHSIGTF